MDTVVSVQNLVKKYEDQYTVKDLSFKVKKENN